MKRIFLFSLVVLLGSSVLKDSDAAEVSISNNVAPDARIFLPSFPQPNSWAQKEDDKIFQKTRRLKNSARWLLSQHDADLSLVHVVKGYSCSVGFVVDLYKAPHLENLLKRIEKAVDYRTSEAKHYWHRRRPYVGTDLPICTSGDALGKYASYPSGHTTKEYGIGLILARLLPDHAARILQRGRIFGESRVICGVHWKSDVEAGFLNAAAQMDVLLAQDELQDDLKQAKVELIDMQRHSMAPDLAECAIEKDAAEHSIFSEP